MLWVIFLRNQPQVLESKVIPNNEGNSVNIFKRHRGSIGLWLVLCMVSTHLWANGALLPSSRIVGYYGNFNSAHMGVLGEYPPEQMLGMLHGEVTKWRAADPSKPVIPAIDYIAVVAEKDPGKDGTYRARMPDSQIQKAIGMANQIKGIAILDVQIGLSTVQAEIEHLASYLQAPNVMLALDPEFAMPAGTPPGHVIGSMDAAQINYAANFLAKIVRDHNLPPKILVVHRFTEHMVTNADKIKPLPEVQIVMNMDGWGAQTLKTDSYRQFIAAQPVEYTGIKLFYKNDLKPPSTGLFTPEELLKFKPQPLFILFQ
jgi:hypothetical protein